MKEYLIYYLAFIIFMSLITLILYGVDKNRSRRGQWRIKESVLLALGFLGGSIGGLAGMSLFRHKTKHWYFRAVNLIGLAWQAVLPLCFLFRA